jgi:hypothetical protein
MIYFKECLTLDDVKIRYRTLAKIFHPDCGGSTELMQKINDEYAIICNHILRNENLTSDEAQEGMKLSEEYRQVIEQIIPLQSIKIEIVGNWIWVTGNTYPVKQQLKSAGLFFASKKQAWYYRAEEFKTKGGKKSLDEIRAKYGSEKVNNMEQNRVID